MSECGAIVLAAGLGTRFGGGKLLAEVDGRPMLQHVLDLAFEARLAPVVVVLGADASALKVACTWRNELSVRNPHPERGLASSVLIGLAKLEASDVQRALVLLGDQPLLGLDQVAAILAAPADSSRPIVVPRHGGKLGNPVLLERKAWQLAHQATGDRGMSQIVEGQPELVRYVDVLGVNPDIDTQADLHAVTRGGGPDRSSRTAGVDRSTP